MGKTATVTVKPFNPQHGISLHLFRSVFSKDLKFSPKKKRLLSYFSKYYIDFLNHLF